MHFSAATTCWLKGTLQQVSPRSKRAMDPDEFQQAAIREAITNLCNWTSIPDSILPSLEEKPEAAVGLPAAGDSAPPESSSPREGRLQLLRLQLVAKVPFVWTATRQELYKPDQGLLSCMHPQAVGTPWGVLCVGGQQPGCLTTMKLKHETSWMRRAEPGRPDQDFSRVFQSTPSVHSKQVTLISQQQQGQQGQGQGSGAWVADHAAAQLTWGLLGHSMVVYKFKAYVFGGQRSSCALDDEVDEKSESGQAVPRCCNDLTAFSLEGLRTGQGLQAPAPTYQQGAVPSPRMCHSATVDARGGIMYLYGGVAYRKRDGARVPADDAVGIIYAYSFELNTWSKMNTTGDCPRSTTLLAFEFHSGCLKAIPDIPLGVGAGRSKGRYQLLQLDLESKVWTRLQTQGQPPPPRCESATALLGDCLLLYGGKDTSVSPNKLMGDVYCLHLDTCTWEQVNPQLADCAASQQQQQQQSSGGSSTAAAAAAATGAAHASGTDQGQQEKGAKSTAAAAGRADVAGGTTSSSRERSAQGMMQLAGHCGAAFRGCAVFYGGYHELVAPKPQPYLQVLVRSVRPPLPAVAHIPGIGPAALSYGIQHCRQQLARLLRSSSSSSSSSSQQVLLKPEEGQAVAVPRALLTLYSQLFDDLFEEMLDGQDGPAVVPLPRVGCVGAQGACRWMMGLISLEGQPLAHLVQIFRAADVLIMEQLLAEVMQQLLRVDVTVTRNAMALVQLAADLPNRAELQAVSGRAEQYLLQQVTPASATVMMSLAVQHKCRALQERCMTLMAQHRKNDVWGVLEFALHFRLVKLQGSCLAHLSHISRGGLVHKAEAVVQAVQKHASSSSTSAGPGPGGGNSSRWQDAPLIQMLQKDLLHEAKEATTKGDRQLLGYVAAAEKLQLPQLREGLLQHLRQPEVWQRLSSTGQRQQQQGWP